MDPGRLTGPGSMLFVCGIGRTHEERGTADFGGPSLGLRRPGLPRDPESVSQWLRITPWRRLLFCSEGWSQDPGPNRPKGLP